ncbi:MAG: hypothetical protein ACREGC_03595, partial [Minisyncoccia bacterium]
MFNDESLGVFDAVDNNDKTTTPRTMRIVDGCLETVVGCLQKPLIYASLVALVVFVLLPMMIAALVQVHQANAQWDQWRPVLEGLNAVIVTNSLDAVRIEAEKHIELGQFGGEFASTVTRGVTAKNAFVPLQGSWLPLWLDGHVHAVNGTPWGAST